MAQSNSSQYQSGGCVFLPVCRVVGASAAAPHMSEEYTGPCAGKHLQYSVTFNRKVSPAQLSLTCRTAAVVGPHARTTPLTSTSAAHQQSSALAVRASCSIGWWQCAVVDAWQTQQTLACTLNWQSTRGCCHPSVTSPHGLCPVPCSSRRCWHASLCVWP